MKWMIFKQWPNGEKTTQSASLRTFVSREEAEGVAESLRQDMPGRLITVRFIKKEPKENGTNHVA